MPITKARQLAEFIANADVDSDEIATGAVSASKLAATLDLSSKTIVLPDVAAFNITSGDVGIGTTSPNSTVHVYGDEGNSISAVMRLRGTNTTAKTTRLQFEDYSGGIADGIIQFSTPNGNHTGAYMGMGYNGTQLNINSNGYVGIGTTSPSAPLTIGSGATRRGSYSDLLIAPGGDNAQIEMWGANTSFAISHFDNDRLGIYSNVSGSWSESRGINIKADGNVGIGTTSPAAKLDVVGGHIRLDAGMSLQWNDSFERIEQSDGHLEFFVNNGESMTLDTHGLGIGVIQAGEKLHVNGTGRFENSYSTPVSVHINSGNNDYGQIFASTASAWKNLVLNQYGGNVGIGTSSPSALLQVEAADGTAGGAIMYTASGVASGYMSANPDGLCLATDTAGITFRTGITGADPTDTGTERMRIDGSGKVLIGDSDSNSDDLLQIETPANGGGQGIHIRRNDSNSSQMLGRVMFGNNSVDSAVQIRADTDGAVNSGKFSLFVANAGGSYKVLEIGSSKNVQIEDGNLILANGHGIDFGATSNSSGSNISELLSDYEHGTWTPTIRSTSSNPSVNYNMQFGEYIRVGRLLHINFYIYVAANRVSGGSGYIKVGGLPFSVQGEANGAYPHITAGYVHTGGAAQVNQGNNVMRFQVNATPTTELSLYSSNNGSFGTGAWELSGSGTLPIY